MLRSLATFYIDAFRGLPPMVWRLAAGLLVNRAGTMVLPFLGLYLVRELGFSTGATSMVLFAFGLGSVAGSYIGGVASGRWGTTKVQVGSLGLAGAGFLALGQVSSAAAMTVGVFLIGAISDAYRPACMTAAVEAAPPETQARCLGLMRLAANSGMAIGPALGGWLATIDYGLIFVGEAVTCWAAAVWLYGNLRDHTKPSRDVSEEPVGVGGSLWRDGQFLSLLGLIFLAALVLFQVFSSLPLYLATDYGLNEGQLGFVFAFNALLIVVFEMVLIKGLEKRDPVLVLGFGLFLMCAGFGLLPLGDSLLFAAVSVTVWTLGEMLAFPFSNVLVAKIAGPNRIGQAMGMYMGVFSIGTVVAPVVGLYTLDHFGGNVLWAGAGLLGIPVWILTVVLARSLRRSAAKTRSADENRVS